MELTGGDAERAKTLHRVYVGVSADAAEPLTVIEAKVQGGKVLLRFEGHEDRTRAEALRGKSLFVEAAEASRPAKGREYIHDLIGCEVRTTDGRLAGTIEDVLDAAGRHLWTVRNGDAEYLLPADAGFVVSVDVKRRVVVVDAPEGLLG